MEDALKASHEWDVCLVSATMSSRPRMVRGVIIDSSLNDTKPEILRATEEFTHFGGLDASFGLPRVGTPPSLE